MLTGASGFIGRHLAAGLSAHDVIPVVRQRGSAGRASGEIVADLSDPSRIRELPPCDVTIHLAQPHRGEPQQAYRGLNVDATRSLLEHGLRSGMSAFVFASTGNVYRPTTEAHDESDPLDEHSSDPYVRTKIDGERIVAGYAGKMRCVVLRLFCPYGPAQRQRMIPDLIERIRRGRPVVLVNDAQPAMNPIHVSDLCDQVAAALDRGLSGPFNVAGNDICDVRELALMIGHLGGWDVRFEEATAPVRFDLVGRNALFVEATGVRPRISIEAGLRELVASVREGAT